MIGRVFAVAPFADGRRRKCWMVTSSREVLSARRAYRSLRRSGCGPGEARSMIYDLLGCAAEFGRLLPADTDPRRVRPSDRVLTDTSRPVSGDVPGSVSADRVGDTLSLGDDALTHGPVSGESSDAAGASTSPVAGTGRIPRTHGRCSHCRQVVRLRYNGTTEGHVEPGHNDPGNEPLCTGSWRDPSVEVLVSSDRGAVDRLTLLLAGYVSFLVLAVSAVVWAVQS